MNAEINFYRAGVAVQLICFGFFAVIALRFNFIAGRFDVAFNERVTTTVNEKYCKVDGAERPFKKNWRVLLRVTNIATAAILVRLKHSLFKTLLPYCF
jgi:hypothetical protein